MKKRLAHEGKDESCSVLTFVRSSHSSHDQLRRARSIEHTSGSFPGIAAPLTVLSIHEGSSTKPRPDSTPRSLHRPDQRRGSAATHRNPVLPVQPPESSRTDPRSTSPQSTASSYTASELSKVCSVLVFDVFAWKTCRTIECYWSVWYKLWSSSQAIYCAFMVVKRWQCIFLSYKDGTPPNRVLGREDKEYRHLLTFCGYCPCVRVGCLWCCMLRDVACCVSKERVSWDIAWHMYIRKRCLWSRCTIYVQGKNVCDLHSI